VTAIRETVMMDGSTAHHNFACYCIALRRIALHRMYGLYPPFNKIIVLELSTQNQRRMSKCVDLLCRK
jgi:hypothetical protein